MRRSKSGLLRNSSPNDLPLNLSEGSRNHEVNSTSLRRASENSCQPARHIALKPLRRGRSGLAFTIVVGFCVNDGIPAASALALSFLAVALALIADWLVGELVDPLGGDSVAQI
jgi:hypothetical protein